MNAVHGIPEEVSRFFPIQPVMYCNRYMTTEQIELANKLIDSFAGEDVFLMIEVRPPMKAAGGEE